jgi:hypothetical protein
MICKLHARRSEFSDETETLYLDPADVESVRETTVRSSFGGNVSWLSITTRTGANHVVSAYSGDARKFLEEFRSR